MVLKKNNSTDFEYICVLGYGWSGSSAVVDLLNEIDGVCQSEVEFRLIKDPHGILDLRRSLVENKNILNSDFAIREFLNFIKILYRIPSKFSGPGMAYKKFWGHDFLEKTDGYIKDLIEFKYHGAAWFTASLFSSRKIFFSKICRKLHIKDDIQMYFPKTSEAYFDAVTKKYLDSLFTPFVQKTKSKKIVLDQGIPANDILISQKILGNPKIIIVDRDPRDIYIDLINGKHLIGKELSMSNNPDIYIKWHVALREGRSEMLRNVNNALLIQFEDLVLNYEASVNKIFQFLDIAPDKHINMREYFNPDISKKNIGLWKDFENQEAIKYIESCLKEFCYYEKEAGK